MGIKLSQKAKGILSIFGSCFIYLVIGSTFMWGSINIYAASYFKNLTTDQVSIVFPVSFTITNVSILLSFPILRYIGFRMTVYLSTFLMFSFFFASTFCPDFWSFFCCFAVGFGGSSGLLYLTLMYNNYKYFPSRRGLIGGISMGMYGLAALISNYILLLLINPKNIKAIKNPETNQYSFPDEIADRFPSALRYLSYYFISIMIIGSLLQFEYEEPEPEKLADEDDGIIVDVRVEEESVLAQKPEDLRAELLPKSLTLEGDFLKENLDKDIQIAQTANPQSNIEEDITEVSEQKLEVAKIRKNKTAWSVASMDSHDERHCKSILDAFKSRVVYIIMVMMYMSSSNGYFMAMNFKNYGITKISDDGFLTLVGSLSSLCNGGSRLFWGFAADKFDFKKIYLTMLVIQILEIATLRFVSTYEIPYLLWVCTSLLCEGGHFVIFPPLSLKVFGPNVGSKIYSLLLLACSATNLTQYMLNLVLRPLIGFDNEFYIFLGMTIVALVFCISSELRFKK